MTEKITRRTALAGAASAAAGATVLGWPSGGIEAKAPFAKTQTSHFYRFMHGRFQATVVSDGPLPLPGAPDAAFKGTSPAELTKLLTDNYLPTANVVLEQNALVVNTGDKLVLFDSGMGTQTMFGPTTGKLIRNLRAASIRPEQIDAVCCSHAHIDHIGGLADTRGRRYFPNAQIFISQADFDFWTDEAKLKTDLKAFVEHARQNLLPYRSRTVFIKDGQEILPGITAMAAPGHTVGHTIFMITSDGKTLCNIGDLTHHQVILVERPRTEFAYDTDPKQSAATRVRMLDMLATRRIPMLAFHFPWPGYGYVSKQGDAFRYHPTPMEIVPIPAAKAAAPAPAQAAPPAKKN